MLSWKTISTIFLQIVVAVGVLQPAPAIVVRVETALGNIDIDVDTVHAPLTAANFLRYVDDKLYDGGQFHRATRPDNYVPQLPDRPPMQIIQAGINSAKRPFAPIPLERTTTTGLKHVSGTVSMARGEAADSATSDFFIGQGFAAFGRVVKGMEVVRRIQHQPVKMQALDPPITIVRIARIQ